MFDKSNRNPHTATSFRFNNYRGLKSLQLFKKYYHTLLEIARGNFRCLAGDSPAFLAVWGGQTNKDSKWNIKG